MSARNPPSQAVCAKDILSRFAGSRILIIGDVMLDEYLHGSVRRISPEAPVPVVELTRTDYIPGGAGNVAVNIASLGGVPLLLGVVGQDAHAGKFEEALQRRGIGGDLLVVDGNRPTTTKTRVVALRHQIVRIDDESRLPLSARTEQIILRMVGKSIDSADGCVLSDYGKGVLSVSLCATIIDLATASGKPVIVDPKTRDLSRYRNASVITPNLKEFCMAAGEEVANDSELRAAADRIIFPQIGDAALLVTKGANGMTLLQPHRAPMYARALAQQVFDVTGAGDTVVSTLAMALAAGASLEDAAGLANIAAGLVVAKPGTASVSIDELRAGAARHNSEHWHDDYFVSDYGPAGVGFAG